MNAKKQILIANSNLATWRADINQHLASGWVVVPTTLAISTAVAKEGGSVAYNEAYAVVLECENYEE